MKFEQFLERYTSVFLVLGILGGLLFPAFFRQYENLVVFMVMIIMGLMYLKVDIIEILAHVKKPLLLTYVSLVNLLLIPLVCYFLFVRNLDPSIGMGVLLLAALPSGVSSAVFTDIMRGKTSLTLMIIVISNLLATITIPFLFWLLYGKVMDLNYYQLTISMLEIIFIPFIVAKFVKQVFFKQTIQNIQGHINIMILTFVSILIMISFSLQAEFLTHHLMDHLKILGLLFISFFLFQILGYFSLFWLKKDSRLAMSNSCMIMNNILGIVLAVAFFNEATLSVIILSFVPWSFMIIFKSWYQRFLP